MNRSPKEIGYRNYITHGEAQFSNRIDAEEFAATLAPYAGRDCGWYWTLGDIKESPDGTFWVVTP